MTIEDKAILNIYEVFGKPPVDNKLNNVNAIETEFAGYRFRSRLEARWAVFFTKFGIEYQYEPEGFQVEVSPDEYVRYLPDFYLPEYDIYAEVKGSDEALKRDGSKIGRCIDYNSTPVSKGLIVLGNIPDPGLIAWGNIPMFPYLYWHKGVVREYASFIRCRITNYGKKIALGNEIIFREMFSYPRDCVDENIPDDTSTNCLWTNTDMRSFADAHFDDLRECYKSARQARFEYGERGV